MTKEEVLEGLKELILELKEDKIKDIDAQKIWSGKETKIHEAAAQLNSCDASWVNDQYGVWFETTIRSS